METHTPPPGNVTTPQTTTTTTTNDIPGTIMELCTTGDMRVLEKLCESPVAGKVPYLVDIVCNIGSLSTKLVEKLLYSMALLVKSQGTHIVTAFYERGLLPTCCALYKSVDRYNKFNILIILVSACSLGVPEITKDLFTHRYIEDIVSVDDNTRYCLPSLRFVLLCGTPHQKAAIQKHFPRLGVGHVYQFPLYKGNIQFHKLQPPAGGGGDADRIVTLLCTSPKTWNKELTHMLHDGAERTVAYFVRTFAPFTPLEDTVLEFVRRDSIYSTCLMYSIRDMLYHLVHDQQYYDTSRLRDLFTYSIKHEEAAVLLFAFGGMPVLEKTFTSRELLQLFASGADESVKQLSYHIPLVNRLYEHAVACSAQNPAVLAVFNDLASRAHKLQYPFPTIAQQAAAVVPAAAPEPSSPPLKRKRTPPVVVPEELRRRSTRIAQLQQQQNK